MSFKRPCSTIFSRIQQLPMGSIKSIGNTLASNQGKTRRGPSSGAAGGSHFPAHLTSSRIADATRACSSRRFSPDLMASESGAAGWTAGSLDQGPGPVKRPFFIARQSANRWFRHTFSTFISRQSAPVVVLRRQEADTAISQESMREGCVAQIRRNSNVLRTPRKKLAGRYCRSVVLGYRASGQSSMAPQQA